MIISRWIAVCVLLALPACFVPVSGQEGGSEPKVKEAKATRLDPSQRDPDAWVPQDPYDLTGPMPTDEEVRTAIKEGVHHVLTSQQENGSWDVLLEGHLLSYTADQAMDAVAVTSLAGISLAPHKHLDERIEPALEKAAAFVIDRIIRGKLSFQVDYACWRYTLALEFMIERHQSTTDADRKALYHSTAKRCMDGLLRIQLNNGERTLMDQRRRARADARAAKAALPGDMGVVLTLPTDQDYRGGAPVEGTVAGSAAEKAGLKPGDRITEAEGIRIENAFDYYLLELEFIQGQTIDLKVKREGGSVESISAQIPMTWPIYTGIAVRWDGNSAIADNFLAKSPALKAGMEVGDKITSINGIAIASDADLKKAVSALAPDKDVKVAVSRGGKSTTVTFKGAYAPEGALDIFSIAEDTSGLDGVEVKPYYEMYGLQSGNPAFFRFPGFAALRLGIKVGDRITHINHVPIAGLDHYQFVSARLPAGEPVNVRWVRGGEQMEKSTMVSPLVQPGSMDVVFVGGAIAGQASQLLYSECRIMQVLSGGSGDKAGLKPGDVITKVEGHNTPDRIAFSDVLMYYSAGDEVNVTFKRKGKEQTAKARLSSPSETPVEEGGWAYYPWMGLATTHSTSAALIALYRGRDLLGLVPPKSALGAGERLITGLRVEDPNIPGLESYLYKADAKQWAFALPFASDIRGNVGRICGCELQQYRAKLRTKDHLKKSVDAFIKYRYELDRVRDFWHTHARHLYQNAAYYWMFGHYYAILAAKEVGGDTAKKTNEIVLKAVMLDREEGGVWNDHHAFGDLIGTCQALQVLGECEGGFRK